MLSKKIKLNLDIPLAASRLVFWRHLSVMFFESRFVFLRNFSTVFFQFIMSEEGNLSLATLPGDIVRIIVCLEIPEAMNYMRLVRTIHNYHKRNRTNYRDRCMKARPFHLNCFRLSDFVPKWLFIFISSFHSLFFSLIRRNHMIFIARFFHLLFTDFAWVEFVCTQVSAKEQNGIAGYRLFGCRWEYFASKASYPLHSTLPWYFRTRVPP